jgi:hypothetical protein
MTSKCHRHPIRQAGSWDFSRRDFKMIGSATSRQCLQQGKVAKQLRCRWHRQGRCRISPDAPQLPSTLTATAKTKQPDRISTTTPNFSAPPRLPCASRYWPLPCSRVAELLPSTSLHTMAEHILKPKPTRPCPSGDNHHRRRQIWPGGHWIQQKDPRHASSSSALCLLSHAEAAKALLHIVASVGRTSMPLPPHRCYRPRL